MSQAQTPREGPEQPPGQVRVMKQAQWVVAAVVAAVMVFAVTFAMNYLGGGMGGGGGPRTHGTARELSFHPLQKAFPPDGTALEVEEKAPGQHDFWFVNTNDQPVKVGVARKSCKCSAVEVHVLGDDGRRRLASHAAALIGAGSSSHCPWVSRIGAVTSQAMLHTWVQRGTEGQELLKHREFATVAPGAVGWVRLKWSGERAGAQGLQATMWFDDDATGRTSSLEVRLHLHEALRVQPHLPMGTIADEELNKGVTQHIICWSSTRKAFRLKVSVVGTRISPGTDPFEVGEPKLLGAAERLELERANHEPPADQTKTGGRVLSAYRVPITLRAMAQDGKTPFDIGQFRRRLQIESPDVEAEPKQVIVTGRVRGWVDVGLGDEDSEVKFGSFPRGSGKIRSIGLTSEMPGLTLRFDRERTPAFLKADPGKPSQAAGDRKDWTVRVTVLPNQANGVFPTRDDPKFEDSAIYLTAEVGGKRRAVRIPVSGMATQ